MLKALTVIGEPCKWMPSLIQLPKEGCYKRLAISCQTAFESTQQNDSSTKFHKFVQRLTVFRGRRLQAHKIISFKTCRTFKRFDMHNNFHKRTLHTKEYCQLIHHLHSLLQGMYVNTNPAFLKASASITQRLASLNPQEMFPILNFERRPRGGDIYKSARLSQGKRSKR